MRKIGIHPFSHDSAICIIDHKKREIFGISTERLTRFKHDYRYVGPLLDQFCNIDKNTKFIISLQDVSKDYIKYFDYMYCLDKLQKKHKYLFNNNKLSKKRKLLKLLFASPVDLLLFFILKLKIKTLSLKKDIESFSEFLSCKYSLKKEHIICYDHHFAHACSTYYSAPSKFRNNSLILTLDGQGDGSFCKVFVIKENKPREIVTSSNDASIPLLYSIFTKVAGFAPNSDEGKVEALACYGKLSKKNLLYKVLENAFSYDENFIIHIKRENKEFPFYSVAKQWNSIEIYLEEWKKRIGEKDFTAAIQLFFENFFLRYIRDLKKSYRFDNLALAGGGFANVKLNLKLVESEICDNIYIYHAMGDEGGAFGALVYDDICEGIDCEWIRDSGMPYYGTSYSKEEVEKVLMQNKEKIKFEYLGNSSYIDLAKNITDNKICALFQGKMEYGPRALGHRSILANPRNPQIREDINMKFKRREWFQPFCPSILEEERNKLFAISYANKHMTCAFTMKEQYVKELPSIVHIDGTARPQFVEKKDDIYYFNLLKELQKINNYGVVLNTSFNIHGKTIVMTPQDALDDFFACGIDFLFIENFKIQRK